MKPVLRAVALATTIAMTASLAMPAWSQSASATDPLAAEGAKTVDLLEQLIRIDTSNAPGDTSRLAALLATRFEALGAEVDVITAPNGRATHFIARLKGDGTKRPVLLAAHADVVPVERDKWTVDPFAAIEKDGFVYGRGAMDFKGGLAVFARAVMRLAEQKTPLHRDVIFLAEADEEQGSFNTSWLAKEHWNRIDAEFALNEGGYVLQDPDGTVRQVNVTTADKVTVPIRLKTTGPVGHASRPLPPGQTAIGQMVAALDKLAAHEPAVKLIPQTRDWLAAVARLNPGPMADGIGKLLGSTDPVVQAEGERQALQAKPAGAATLHALLRDTMTITMMKSGVEANVIPGEATALVDVRLLPKSTTDQLLEEMKRVVGNPGVTIEMASPASQEATRAYFLKRSTMPASPTSTDLYQALARNARLVWPKADTVPTLFEAGTDAIAWRERGVPVYGIYPYPLDDDILRGMHGHDERISIKSLYEGTDWVWRVLVDVATK
ncbi:MAG: peptidase [Rhizobacter sp.]|nr:peptidase [Rhizobacter sp.]